MSTPDFPASDTAPKAPYPPASMITPLPRLPKQSRKAWGFGWGAVGSAVLSGLTWAIKEAGADGTLKWLLNVLSKGGLALAVIAAVIACALFIAQLLISQDKRLMAAEDRAERRDERMGQNLNELTTIAAKQQASTELLTAMVREETHLNRTRDAEISQKVDRLERKVDRLAGDTPDPDDATPPARPRPRRMTGPGVQR